MVRLVSKMVLFSKVALIRESLLTVFSFSVTLAIMWGILKNFRHQVEVSMKTYKTDIITKDYGKRICNTGRELRNIRIKMSIMVDSCAEANSDKESTNLRMGEYTKVLFIMDIATAMEN